jgi:hypothetical protein
VSYEQCSWYPTWWSLSTPACLQHRHAMTVGTSSGCRESNPIYCVPNAACHLFYFIQFDDAVHLIRKPAIPWSRGPYHHDNHNYTVLTPAFILFLSDKQSAAKPSGFWSCAGLRILIARYHECCIDVSIINPFFV